MSTNGRYHGPVDAPETRTADELVGAFLRDFVKPPPPPEVAAMLAHIPIEVVQAARISRINATQALAVAKLVHCALLGRLPSREENMPIFRLLRWLLEEKRSGPASRKNDEQLLDLCYIGRVEARWTWPQVADFASDIGPGPITPATIRKRVERYAADAGYPPTRRYTRRSKEGKGGQI